MGLDFKHWLNEREQNEGIADALSWADDKMHQAKEFGKKTKDRLHLIVRNPNRPQIGPPNSYNRTELIEKTYDDIIESLGKLQRKAIQGAKEVADALASTHPIAQVNKVVELPILKQVKWIIKALWTIIGGSKVVHALLDATPRTMWRPIRTFFDWIFKPDVKSKDIGIAMINMAKLVPALSFTGALKMTLPWQMQWFGWSLEEGLKYNMVLAWGMYFIYLAACFVKGNKWFDWYYKIVMIMFPDEFKDKKDI